VCRICLGEENEGVDPLISPCKCAGTMSHIHLECLREWLNSKRTMKEGPVVTTYCWKNLQCELCVARFPQQVYTDGTVVSDKLHLSAKQLKKLGKPVDILEYETPESDFLVIESVTLQNIRIVHVIDMREKSYIKIGRGHEVDIRVTDISVSRLHARISQGPEGDFYVEDNKSKFGTLLQVRQPIPLMKEKNNYFQMGRTYLQVRIEDDGEQEAKKNQSLEKLRERFCCCLKKAPKKTEGYQWRSTDYPREFNRPRPEEDEHSERLATQADNAPAELQQTQDGHRIAQGLSPERPLLSGMSEGDSQTEQNNHSIAPNLNIVEEEKKEEYPSLPSLQASSISKPPPGLGSSLIALDESRENLDKPHFLALDDRKMNDHAPLATQMGLTPGSTTLMPIDLSIGL
jgi:pSer/pThr/pTyr-binding forkhead associated (FHA) protein